jgi:Domain of unknown function (DUF4419)
MPVSSSSAVTHRSDASITFEVHAVSVGSPPDEVCTTKEYIEATLRSGFEEGNGLKMYSVEGCSRPNERVLALPFANALIGAVHVAFSRHLPLALSPDTMWLAIAQGFALHIRNNPEALRTAFVFHDEKATITVDRPDFIPGSPNNPWPEVFEIMAGAVHGEVGAIGDVLIADFSTTGPIERAASQVVMLGAFEPYFRYVLRCICGIPRITLEGTPDDWLRLKGKVECLRSYDCDWWIRELLPICDQFVRASQGDIDGEFWKRIYKIEEVYGGQDVEGWIGKLFPYVKTFETQRWDRRNPLFDGGRVTVTSGEFPNGLTRIPFNLQRESASDSMSFLAGFTGATYDEKLATIRPCIGWAVCPAPGIERVIQRLNSEGHQLRPPRKDLDKVVDFQNQPGFTQRNPIWELEPDVRRFFETCDGGDLFSGSYRIVSLADLCGKSGPSWRWKILGSLSDGSQLTLGDGIIRFRMEEGPEIGTVVALTLTEFLQRALDSKGELYMDAPDFVPYPFPKIGNMEFDHWSLYYDKPNHSFWNWESES